MAEMKVCPVCSTKIPKDAKECSTCGEVFEVAAPAQQEIECPSCMSLIPSGVGECPVCGEKLAPASPAPAPEAPKPAEPAKPKTRDCPECGVTVEADAIECVVCGYKFEYEDLSLPVVKEAAPAPKPAAKPAPAKAPSKPTKPAKASQKKAPPKAPEPAPEPFVMAEKSGDVKCPACGEMIPAGSRNCPLCGANMKDYMVRCPNCGEQIPATDDVCPECFARVREGSAPAEEEAAPAAPEIVVTGAPPMMPAEAAEGRECLVCGAILDAGSDNCPVCKQVYGTELPPEEEMSQEWEGVGIEIPKDYFKCPVCETVLTDTEPTEVEATERKWFYRAIIFLFTGIFMTSLSIWVRGVTVEAQTSGLKPLPLDWVVNTLGWILVVIGFLFWFKSWKATKDTIVCPNCGAELEEGAKECPECHEVFDAEEKDENEDLKIDLKGYKKPVQYEAGTSTIPSRREEPVDGPAEEKAEGDDWLTGPKA